jgi:dihydrofolate reductase
MSISGAASATLRRRFSIIMARDLNDGIGHAGNTIAWDAPEDAKFFDDFSKECAVPEKMNCVIMGRKTFESMPPLAGRFNVVLSRNPGFSYDADNVKIIHGDVDAALQFLATDERMRAVVHTVFVGGGEAIAAQCFAPPCRASLDTVHVTRIHVDAPPATAFFRQDLAEAGMRRVAAREQISVSGVKMTFEQWENV